MKLVLGSTPVAKRAAEQYRNLGYEVHECDTIPDSLLDCDELFVALPRECDDNFMADSHTLSKIKTLLAPYEIHDGKKLLCQILLYSSNALYAFKTSNMVSEYAEKVEIWPFTMEELCAGTILFDHHPVLMESENTIHVVIFGMTQWAESIAETAAYVCHYPNYIRNHSLRTRITIIDENIESKSAKLLTRYANLFANSFVRVVDVDKKTSKVIRPIYYGQREDFVDIEWEFVNGRVSDVAVLTKLKSWSEDPLQHLTVALCYDDAETNVSAARLLAESNARLYMVSEDNSLFDLVKLPDNVLPLGSNYAMDVSLPLRRKAQIVNYVYSECYNYPKDKVMIPSEIDTEAAEAMWNKMDDSVLRWSSVYNAMTIGTKMHSLCHESEDWTTFYSMTSKEISMLANVEHNRWTVEKLMAGFRPPTDEERKAVLSDPGMKKVLKRQKVHTDLCSYNELGQDETGKNVRIYDICLSGAIPLIASVFARKEEEK